MKKSVMKKGVRAGLIGSLLLLLALAGGCTIQGAAVLPVKAITIYKSSGCGCCGLYSGYLEDRGLEVTVKDVQSITPIKERFEVPDQVRSCHTSVIGDYFVEGHVPFEAIEKLLTEQPDIKGIALEGMPPGSPGMPGKKNGRFVVYAVGNNGELTSFMEI